ncbi:MAG TPA: hypothetical protein VLQ80_05335 [Candidatus Saccharimonadia bacterium]|nr:hypothetical protein [Candidatus Saccharimonadia bacterium]
MSDPRCAHCHQPVQPTPAGLACGCALLRNTLALRLWLALETIPKGWPVGELVALLEAHVARLEQDTGGEAGS